MADVTCEHCNLTYNDTYRLTYCPHEFFVMRTWAYNSLGEGKLCTSIAELNEFMARTKGAT